MTGCSRITINDISKEYKQKLTHQTIIGRYISTTINEPSKVLDDYKMITKAELKSLPFPAFINQFLNSGNL
jgi:A/G-specific adenine glycosylase